MVAYVVTTEDIVQALDVGGVDLGRNLGIDPDNTSIFGSAEHRTRTRPRAVLHDVHGDVNFSRTDWDDLLRGAALPSGWVDASTPGGSVVPLVTGLELRTATDSVGGAAVARALSPGAFFAVSVDLEVLNPASTTAPDVAEMGRLEVSDTGTGVVSMIVSRNAGALQLETIVAPVATGDVNAGAQLLSSSRVRLEIVVGGRRVWGLVDGAVVASAVIEGFDNTPAKVVELRLNSTSTRAARSRWTDYRVRSHASVGRELLREASYPFPKRIRGTLPPGDAGLRDLTVFGPWGAETVADAFEYRIETFRTLATVRGKPTIVITDRVVRDDL